MEGVVGDGRRRREQVVRLLRWRRRRLCRALGRSLWPRHAQQKVLKRREAGLRDVAACEELGEAVDRELDANGVEGGGHRFVGRVALLVARHLWHILLEKLVVLVEWVHLHGLRHRRW